MRGLCGGGVECASISEVQFLTFGLSFEQTMAACFQVLRITKAIKVHLWYCEGRLRSTRISDTYITACFFIFHWFAISLFQQNVHKKLVKPNLDRESEASPSSGRSEMKTWKQCRCCARSGPLRVCKMSKLLLNIISLISASN